jgi:nitrogen fixation/metabolism regulation signal transduction histidine kinase
VAVSAIVQLVVFILLFYFASIYWTHKVAGPLYRLKMTFQRLVTGDWSPMYQVRKGDQLKEIPALFNRVLDEVGSTDAEIRDELLASGDRLQGVDGGNIDNMVLAETRRRLIELLDKHWPI